jgi:hypothetical protein
MGTTISLITKGNELSLEIFAAQIRRYFVLDIVIGIIYGVKGWSEPSSMIKVITLILACMYLLDGVIQYFITEPSRVHSLPVSMFHANTALNGLTLGLNVTYNIFNIISSPYWVVAVSIFTTAFKVAKCYNLHQLAAKVSEYHNQAKSYATLDTR